MPHRARCQQQHPVSAEEAGGAEAQQESEAGAWSLMQALLPAGAWPAPHLSAPSPGTSAGQKERPLLSVHLFPE